MSNPTVVIISLAVVAIVGLVVGLLLGVASIKFAVEVDEKEAAILAALPGNNCGGCGFPGCSGLAEAIAQGKAAVNTCPVGGEPVGNVIAGIMGVEASAAEKKVAFVKCIGCKDITKENYDYTGTQSCTMASYAPAGGPKSCKYGCMGFGSCVAACPFDAIHVVNGVAVVDKDACKACGKCVAACPKHLIEIIPYKSKHQVQCSSKDKGPVVMKACEVGCIGCMKCKKACPKEAIEVESFLAKIDYSKCVNCGLCARECPRKVIS